MATTVTESTLLRKLETRTKGAWKKAKGVEPKVKGSTLPSGLVLARARLVGFKLGATEKKGDPYFQLSFVTVLPSEYAGARFTKLYVIAETEWEGKLSTIQEKLEKMASDLQIIGIDTDKCENEKQLVEAIKAHVKASPVITFNTWTAKKRPGDKNDPQLQIFFQGVDNDYEPELPPEAVEDNSEPLEDPSEPAEEPVEEPAEEPIEEAVEPEDELAPMTRDQLKKFIAAKKLTGQIKLYQTDSDEDIRNKIREVLTPAEPVEEPAEEPVEAASGEGDYIPQVKDIFLCKFTPKGDSEEGEVVAVDTKKQTVDLKRLKDKKIHKGIPFSKLHAEA